MKFARAIVLFVAAVSLIALTAPNIASATVLCKNGKHTSECSERWPVGTTIKTTLMGTAAMDMSIPVECTGGSAHGKLTTEGSSTSTVIGGGTSTHSNCSCPTTVLKTGTLEAHHIAGTHDGTLSSREMEVTTHCSTIFGTIHCVYGTPEADAGIIEGGNTPFIKYELELPRVTEGLCTEVAFYTAEFAVQSPSPAYVAAG